MKMLLAAILSLGLLVSAGPARAEAEISDCSAAQAQGERTLCHEAVLPAPLEQVWALWGTSEGLASWMAPVAAIEARAGGFIEASYDPAGRIGAAGNIRNRILTIDPQQALRIQVAQAPPNFPHAAEVMQLTTLIEFEVVNAAATRVRVSMSGYREGEAYEALYRHFAWGNAWTLNKLHERVTIGPVDWAAASREAAQ